MQSKQYQLPLVKDSPQSKCRCKYRQQQLKNVHKLQNKLKTLHT